MMSEGRTLIEKAQEMAAIAKNERDLLHLAKGCRIVIDAINRSEPIEWLTCADLDALAATLAEDVAVLTLAADLHRKARNGPDSEAEMVGLV